jgi:hypothetical protein
MKINFIITIALVHTLLFTSSVWAHQQKSAITKILFNQRSGNIEVMHRFIVHDAEHAVHALFGMNADIIANEITRNTFGKYVSKSFSLKTLEKQKLKLDYVGHSLEGMYFWVYQEIAIPKTIKGFIVYHSSLIDLWPSQTNMVNIEGQGDIKTATFSGGSTEYVIEF